MYFADSYVHRFPNLKHFNKVTNDGLGWMKTIPRMDKLEKITYTTQLFTDDKLYHTQWCVPYTMILSGEPVKVDRIIKMLIKCNGLHATPVISNLEKYTGMTHLKIDTPKNIGGFPNIESMASLKSLGVDDWNFKCEPVHHQVLPRTVKKVKLYEGWLAGSLSSTHEVELYIEDSCPVVLKNAIDVQMNVVVLRLGAYICQKCIWKPMSTIRHLIVSFYANQVYFDDDFSRWTGTSKLTLDVRSLNQREWTNILQWSILPKSITHLRIKASEVSPKIVKDTERWLTERHPLIQIMFTGE
jgi:hypothetical protein